MRGGLRRRLVTTVAIVSAFALVLIVAGFNVALRSSLDSNADSLLRARAQAALEGVNVMAGKVAIRETSDAGAPDAQVWIYSGSRNIERPPVGPELDSLADTLQSSGSGTTEDPDSDTRLYALPIRSNGQTVGTVVAGITLEPYEQTAKQALFSSIAFGLLIFVGIAITTRILISRSLKPVADMTEAVADWSVHDIDRRFDTGPPTDELTNLAATFDQMLDRMATMVRHERNFSAEISHELRTPLASISAEAELALRRQRTAEEYRTSLERISGRSGELNAIVETLLEAARAEASTGLGDSCELREAVAGATESAREMAVRLGVAIRVAGDPGEPALIQGSERSVRRILAPVFENAVVYARGRVAVAVALDGQAQKAFVSVRDDGPGFAAGDAELAFLPGKRGEARRNAGAPEGVGLGLPLARRLVRNLGGELTITTAMPGKGAEVVIAFRLAEATT